MEEKKQRFGSAIVEHTLFEPLECWKFFGEFPLGVRRRSAERLETLSNRNHWLTSPGAPWFIASSYPFFVMRRAPQSLSHAGLKLEN